MTTKNHPDGINQGDRDQDSDNAIAKKISSMSLTENKKKKDGFPRSEFLSSFPKVHTCVYIYPNTNTFVCIPFILYVCQCSVFIIFTIPLEHTSYIPIFFFFIFSILIFHNSHIYPTLETFLSCRCFREAC